MDVDEIGRVGGSTWEADVGSVRLLFGLQALDRLGEVVRPFGRRALLVTDRGLRDVGHVDRGIRILADAGVETAVYDGVEQNPTTRHVDEAVEVARDHAADCIVGFGGGSSLDCAKGANFLLTGGGRMEDYQGSGKAHEPMLPSIGVPTTAGTGSEAQSYALISQEGSHVKMACGDRKAMFRAAILDPALAASVPPDVAAVAGIDAVSHAVESYVTTRRNPISAMYAREAFRLLDANFDGILARGVDLAACSGMLLGSHLAGAAIERSMLGAAHACANPLTARFGIRHGIAVGLMLPSVMRFNASHVGELYDELMRASRPESPALLDHRVQELLRAAGLPEHLRDYPVPRGCLGELAAEAERQWTAGFNPRPVQRAELLEIYESAY